MTTDERRFRDGLLFGLIAYVWWGLVPLYFRQVRHVEPLEILAHRIVWSVAILFVVTLLFGGFKEIARVLGSRKLVVTLGLSALLLSINWLLYIYAAVNDRLTEASIGYYMMPLVNAFLATVFLGEKLKPAHYPALGLVAIGVLIPMFALGSGWLSLALPISFGFYGLLRKKVAVESLTGLCVESLLLLPICLGYLMWQTTQGTTGFGTTETTTVLLMCGGIITVVPLLAFGMSIRRLPLLTITFIQFLSPSMQFLVALFWSGETPPWPMWAAVGCVLTAVAVFMIDAARDALAKRRSLAERDRAETHLLGVQPAVDGDDQPRAVPGGVARQEREPAGDVLDGRRPA